MLLSILRRLNKPLLVAFMVLFSHVSVSAGVTDLKLSTAQIFDVQWNISGGKLNASGFNYIYSSVNYATQTTSAARWTAAQTQDASANGRYIGFFNSTTNPGTYGMAVFNADGTRYKTINNTGSFRALADGAIFYNGNGMWGTLITTGQGYNLGQSGSWTVTQDRPTNAQLEAYTPPSSTPLAPGETAQTSAPPPPPPTPVYSSGMSAAQNTRVNKVQVNPQGHNAEVNITGSSNDIHIEQAGSPNYILLNVLGNSNKVDATQSASSGAHMYNETNIIGDRNDVSLLQTGTSNKSAFVSVNGSDNTASVIQKDSGQHYLQLDITGNNHNASVLQQGTGSHKATVTLDGSQPWNFDLTQSGATGQTYSLPHAMSDGASVSGTCSAVGGCNLLVNQQ
jgi:hypothetical protein